MDIIKGTTPSFIVDFTGIDDIRLADVIGVTLTMKHHGEKSDLSTGVNIDVTNKLISYHFSQEQTFDLIVGRPVELQMDVKTSDGEVYRVADVECDVKPTLRSGVM